MKLTTLYFMSVEYSIQGWMRGGLAMTNEKKYIVLLIPYCQYYHYFDLECGSYANINRFYIYLVGLERQGFSEK